MTPQERTAHLRLAVGLVAEKWRLAVLHLLAGGPLRRTHVQKALDYVSAKVLTQTLRGLERDGLVERIVHATGPLWVEYRLTEIAVCLLPAMDDLCRWSQAHGHETIVARTRYDAGANAMAASALR